jgi:spore germination cell wall hydrolase CwlJ-like protein
MILISPLKVEGTALDYDYDYGMHGDSFEMTRDTYCMALNIYHESRSENLAGKFAVADVVMNRVNDRR